MTGFILFAEVAICLLAIVALGWGLQNLMQQWSAYRGRRVLLGVAQAIEGALSAAEAEASNGIVPVAADGLLERALERELPCLTENTSRLGPALRGISERIRLAGEGFRVAYRESAAGRAAQAITCDDMRLQLGLAIAELFGRFDSSRAPPRQTMLPLRRRSVGAKVMLTSLPFF